MFICTIADDGSFESIGLGSDDDHLVRIPLGYDDETNNVYSALVAFSTLPGQAHIGGFELTATVVETALDGSHISDKFDGQETRNVFVAAEDRAKVRMAFQAATAHLFDVVKPQSVSMYTFVAHLPRKALEKFNQLASIALEKGYAVTRGKPWNGYHSWQMTREAEGTAIAE